MADVFLTLKTRVVTCSHMDLTDGDEELLIVVVQSSLGIHSQSRLLITGKAQVRPCLLRDISYISPYSFYIYN